MKPDAPSVFAPSRLFRAGAWKVTLAIAACAAAFSLATCSAQASGPVVRHLHLRVSNSQAGGHPDLTTTFILGSRGGIREPNETGDPAETCNCQDPRNVSLEYPAGVVGLPTAVPMCSAIDFASQACPPDSQVGIVNVEAGILFDMTPVYNLVPRPGEPGLIGFIYPDVNFPVFFLLSARTESDYGLNAEGVGITQVFPLEFMSLQLWGVPSSPTHDKMRFPLGVPYCFAPGLKYGHNQEWEDCAVSPPLDTLAEIGEYPEVVTEAGVPSNAPEVPYLQNPTNCGAVASVVTSVLTYDNQFEALPEPWPTMTGCDQLTFNPSLFAQPTSSATDSPSGMESNLRVPQELSATVPSPSGIKANTLTLPVGFSLNPAASDGKVACTDAEARFGTREEAQCPENSKIGSLTLEDPALPGPLRGYIYIGQPRPGETFRVFLVANGFSLHIKLAGTTEPDPVTGQIVVRFENLPQNPLSDFNLHFFGAERGLLVTPDQCGSYPVKSTFAPWNSELAEQTSTQFFTIDSGPEGAPCPPQVHRFAPHLRAGSVDSAAGAHSPMSFELTRGDSDQNFTGLKVAVPPGLSATLKGIPYCSEAQLASAEAAGHSGLAEQAGSSCPAASQIGTSTAAAGAGTHPGYLPGKVYLAGPYKGAPLSIADVTPAVSGPYDLGNVVVRAALQVDPETAQVTAVSDLLPQIHRGIPLHLREIRINLDRENFTLNPTDCEPLSIDALVRGDQGAATNLTERFQAANCASLPFAPKLGLRFTGGLNRRGHPAVHATLDTQPGEANLRSVSVTLPPNELIDNAHFGTVCLKGEFAAHNCPAGSLLGQVTVASPLLDQPLRGSAYLRTSDRSLPDVALDLNGQFHIETVAHIDSVHGALRTTFANLPDVPVGAVTVNLLGRAKGLIQNSKGICGSRLKAKVTIQGQNGALNHSQPKLQASCRRTSEHRRKAREN